MLKENILGPPVLGLLNSLMADVASWRTSAYNPQSKAVYTDQELMMINEQLDPDIYECRLDGSFIEKWCSYPRFDEYERRRIKSRYYLSGSFLDKEDVSWIRQ